MVTRILLLVVGLTLVQSCFADTITIDADAFPAGTVLNNAFPGVTLTAVGDPGVLVNNDVIAETDPYATTGTQVFADTSSSPTSWGDGSFSYLRVDFAGGTTQVSLDFAADDSSDSNPYLEAFDSSNNLVDSATAGLVPLGSPVTLTVSASDIAYIEASWDQVNRSDNGILDNLRYETPVPEPSSLSLITLAGSVLLYYRRRLGA